MSIYLSSSKTKCLRVHPGPVSPPDLPSCTWLDICEEECIHSYYNCLGPFVLFVPSFFVVFFLTLYRETQSMIFYACFVVVPYIFVMCVHDVSCGYSSLIAGYEAL